MNRLRIEELRLDELNEIDSVYDRTLLENIIKEVIAYGNSNRSSLVSIDKVSIVRDDARSITVCFEEMTRTLSYSIFAKLRRLDDKRVLSITVGPSRTDSAICEIDGVDGVEDDNDEDNDDGIGNSRVYRLRLEVVIARFDWYKSAEPSEIRGLAIEDSMHPDDGAADAVVTEVPRFVERELRSKLDEGDFSKMLDLYRFMHGVYGIHAPHLLFDVTREERCYNVVCSGFSDVHSSWLESLMKNFSTDFVKLKFVREDVRLTDRGEGSVRTWTQPAMSMCASVRKASAPIEVVSVNVQTGVSVRPAVKRKRVEMEERSGSERSSEDDAYCSKRPRVSTTHSTSPFE